MPDNWINQRKLTGEDAIYDLDGNKIHDLIDTEIHGGEALDAEKRPILYDKISVSNYILGELTELPVKPTNIRGFYAGGDYFIYGSTTSDVYIIDSEGVLITNFNASVTFTQGITVLNDIIYIVSNNSLMKSFTLNGVQTGSYSVTSETLAVTNDGTYLYTLGDADGLIRKYTSSGVYVETMSYVSEEAGNLSYYDGSFYFKANLGTKVFKYNSVWSLEDEIELGTGFDYARFSVSPLGYYYNLYTIPDKEIYKIDLGKLIPTLTRPTGSLHPYKIVADATSE